MTAACTAPVDVTDAGKGEPERWPLAPRKRSFVRPDAICHGSASPFFWHGPGEVAIADSCDRVN
jgi:hypothetical protein